MGLFGGLKFEHRIYNKDFSSKEHFDVWMDKRIEKLEEIREDVKLYKSDNWNMVDNNQLATDLEDTIDDIIDDLNTAITELNDKKSSLKE